jgi:hypothetical protein
MAGASPSVLPFGGRAKAIESSIFRPLKRQLPLANSSARVNDTAYVTREPLLQLMAARPPAPGAVR